MFYLYSLTASLSKKIPKNDFNLKLLKYITCFSKLKDLDLEVTKTLVDFTEVISKNKSLRLIENKIMDLGSLITKIRTQAKTMKKKFGMESKFCKIYATFLRDVMNDEKGKSLLEKYGLVSTRMSLVFRENSDFDSKDPLLIISGRENNIGTIVYANSIIYSLLKMNSPSDLIGSNLKKLITPPFDEIINKILVKFLLYNNSSQINQTQLFLIDQERYCIEVIILIDVTFFNLSPYFVLRFKPIIPTKNFLLFSISGHVYSMSQNIKNFFAEKSYEIGGLIPNIEKYLDNYELGQTFEYSEKVSCLMKKSELCIENKKVTVLYLFESQMDICDDISIQKKNLKAVNFKNIAYEEKTNDYKGKESESSQMKKILSVNPCNIDLAKKFLKYLKAFIIISVIIEIIVTLGIVLLIYQIIWSVSVNTTIFNIGFMRFFSCSILTNARSLDLLSQNFTLAYDESTYRNLIYNNTIQLQTYLNQYKTMSIPLTNQQKQFFNDPKLEMYSIKNKDIETYQTTLFNAVQKVIEYSFIISNTSLKNFQNIYDNFLFLYRNIPSDYFRTLNETVMSVTNQ